MCGVLGCCGIVSASPGGHSRAAGSFTARLSGRGDVIVRGLFPYGCVDDLLVGPAGRPDTCGPADVLAVELLGGRGRAHVDGEVAFKAVQPHARARGARGNQPGSKRGGQPPREPSFWRLLPGRPCLEWCSRFRGGTGRRGSCGRRTPCPRGPDWDGRAAGPARCWALGLFRQCWFELRRVPALRCRGNDRRGPLLDDRVELGGEPSASVPVPDHRARRRHRPVTPSEVRPVCGPRPGPMLIGTSNRRIDVQLPPDRTRRVSHGPEPARARCQVPSRCRRRNRS